MKYNNHLAEKGGSCKDWSDGLLLQKQELDALGCAQGKSEKKRENSVLSLRKK
jgi:hypothetical protein